MYSRTKKPLHAPYMYIHGGINVSKGFDSDLKKLKAIRVGLNINCLFKCKLTEWKINNLREICKESLIDILCVDERKIESSYPDCK